VRFATFILSIPSPSSNAIHIGPLQLRAYGLMIALGVIAAVWLAGRRLEVLGIGTREDMAAIALWAVPAGVIGARAYHVITDWMSFRGDWWRAFKIWEGGLGIWGGIALGVIVGLAVGKRRGINPVALLDAATPALPLAQAIGRLGNWFNQELFGKPTDLPWALEVSRTKAITAGYPPGTTFHPTFLYEALWNLALCAFLLVYDRARRADRHPLKPGSLFALYVAGYTFVRFFIERIRIDTAYKLWGLRVNEWVAAVVFVLAVLYLIVFGRARAVPVAVEETDLTESVDDGQG
jgi:prolipoprotein diacylglyceryl transferase